VRTAVLGGVRDVWIVKEGDLVEARFRILRITPVAVEVLDTVSQRALALRWQ
jgi:hypothetical protein